VKRILAALAAFAFLTSVMAVTSAFAQSTSEAAGSSCPEGYQYERGLGCARRRADGLYEVRLADGSTVLTHGLDPETADHGSGFDVNDPKRSPICRADGAYRTVVLYTYLKGTTNNGSTAKPTIQDAVERMNYVLNEEAQESSKGNVKGDYEVKCISGTTEISVGAFVSSAKDFSTIVLDARNAGFEQPEEKYLIFADFDADACGVARVINDDKKYVDNPANTGNKHGVVYEACWNGRTPMHELSHTMGAVQYDAPDSSGKQHCNDGLDVMCYSDGGPKSNYDPGVCPNEMQFDCKKDSYFDAQVEPDEWLDTHWNIGWSANRFIYLR
jgi:hypothetical protein